MFKKTLLVFIMMTAQAFAQQADNKPAARDSDKLDIKKLEQKYWAAKDDDFSVVQNRRYVKADRFYLSAAAGIPVNDPYNDGNVFNANIGYFFNERWGIEATYNSFDLKKNDNTKQFDESYGTMPNHNTLKSSYYLSGTFVPFYAKMSVVDKAIIYFDMGVSVGVGNISYDIAQKQGDISENTFAYRLAVFQQIFFSEHFAIRADLINTWSDQKKMKYDALPNANRDLGSENVNDTSLMIGITYWH